ncbi:MAG: hypothetical protein D6766_11935 [Verrucomicrobia bacterium]|nr:MAG: hypothetical protein D6766_11935 [Verrucomicrobiota bacterium]
MTSKLDPGGSLFLYLSTDQWLAGLADRVAGLRDAILALPDMPERERRQVRRGFALAENLVRNSGIETIAGVGMSSVAVEPGLYRFRWVMARTAGAAEDGYMWRWFGSEPHALDWLGWMPTNTAYLVNLDLDLAGVWSALRREARAAGIPAFERALDRWEARVEQEVGRSLSALLGDTAGNVGIALVLDPSRPVALPGPGGGAFEIPQPELAVGLKVRNPRIYETLAGWLRRTAPPDALESGGEGEVRWIGMAQPMPWPLRLQPTLGVAGDYLWLTTTREVFTRLRRVHAGEEPSLRTTPEFQRLSRGLPDRGNSVAFVSAAFGRLMQRWQEATLAMLEQDQPALAQVLRASGLLMGRVAASYAVGWHDATGSQAMSQSTEDPVNQLARAVVVGPLAMSAGMLLPALATARDRAQDVVCRNNLKQLALGLLLYADDHQGQLPEDLAAIREYVPSPEVFFCPLDPAKPDPVPKSWERLPAHAGSYEFLTPGVRVEGATASKVTLRCPFHGSVAHMDGSVTKENAGR